MLLQKEPPERDSAICSKLARCQFMQKAFTRRLRGARREATLVANTKETAAQVMGSNRAKAGFMLIRPKNGRGRRTSPVE